MAAKPEQSQAAVGRQPSVAVPAPPDTALDVPFDGTVSWFPHVVMTIQNVFAMTGLFLFPAILGLSLHLKPGQTIEVYGATFVISGIGTVLQATVGLKLPIMLGPWAATLAGLVAAAAIAGRAAAYGSFFVAALIWVALSLPIRGFSFIGHIGRLFRDPILYGGIVLLAITTLTEVTVVDWIGSSTQPGFGAANWVGGAVAIAAITAAVIGARGLLRAGAMLWGIILGAAAYAAFQPISFARVRAAPWFYQPAAFPLGFSVNWLLVVLFVLLLTTGVASSLGLYHVVAGWGELELPGQRMAWGIFGQSLATSLGALLGSFSATAYPDNLGIVRMSRIGSRWIVASAGGLLVVGGFVLKFDAIFVSIPSSVIAAAAIVLFGIIFATAIEALGRVAWDQLNSVVLGVPFMVAIGGLFVKPATIAHYPLIAREVIPQSLFVGPVLLVVLHLLVNKLIRPRLHARQRSTTEAAS